jgi:multiple sugar transport system substrate-binding protein
MAADATAGPFTSDGHVVGIPYDASFMVTTVNTEMLTKAGVNAAPQTMDDYTAALQKIRTKASPSTR